MAGLTLSRILKTNPVLLDYLQELDGEAVVLGLDNIPAWGRGKLDGLERHPVLLDGQTIGWVTGGSRPAELAGLLSWLAAREAEKKTLAGEVLDRYRELNLLYHLSETLGASPFPDAIAATALAAAVRIIPAQSGQILLKPGQSLPGQILATSGEAFTVISGCQLVERVLSTGKAELTNAAAGEDIFKETGGLTISALCAPLKTDKNTLGVILLASPGEKTYTAGDLKLLNSIALQAAPVIEVSRLYQIEIEKTRLESELQLARKVQESLLPEKMPRLDDWQFDQRWRPLRDVSGDFYDIIPEGAQRLGLVTADVTDKGMPASLFMVFIRSVLRASITRQASPERALANANRVICQDSYRGLFATLFYARLDTAHGDLTYVNAGHPPAVFYSRAADSLQLLPRTGMALGVDLQAAYTSEQLRLEEGDFILFYTDGVIEAENPEGMEFGLEHLMQEVFTLRQQTTGGILDGLEQALAKHTMSQVLQDDLTMLLVRRGPADGGAQARRSPPDRASGQA